MKILLIGINFGKYEKRIVEELEKLGHTVSYMYDANPNNNFYSRLFAKEINHKINSKYRERIYAKFDKGNDLVICIVGRELSKRFLQELKHDNPNAAFVLYLWDDVKRVNNFEEVNRFYDSIYSFDLKDCCEYGFYHLPLFFSERNDGQTEKTMDVYSAMFDHSERESIIRSVAKIVKAYGASYKFYLSLGRYGYVKRWREIKHSDNIINYIATPIPEEENYENMKRARIILDVQFSGQVGLTMRTIESLGMKNKLITTNKNIRYYDFYEPDNIQIIDKDKIEVDKPFIEKPYKEIDNEIYEKYSLRNWAKTLTGEKLLDKYIIDCSMNEMEFD